MTDNRPVPDPPGSAPNGDHTELDRLGDEIAELSAHICAATYRLLTLIREFDQRHGWSGARSCAHWLTWRTGHDLRTAREKVRVARALEHLPRISDAMRTGKISYSKVRAMTRVATPETESALLNVALHGTASHVEKVVRAWRKVEASQDLEETDRRRKSRYLRTYWDDDGMLVVSARLEPEAGATLLQALKAGSDVLFEQRRDEEKDASAKARKERQEERERSGSAEPCQRMADAMGLVAESALQNGLDKGTRGDRYQVVVHVEAEPVEDGVSGERRHENGSAEHLLCAGVIEEGPHLAAESVRRIACDAGMIVMSHGTDGSVLGVGRKRRTIPTALRRALARRDGGCRFPGCGIPFCDAHHIEHWADGGETKLSNLLELCRMHHAALHEGGYRLELGPDGEPRFFHPAGWEIPAVPPPPRLGESPITELRRKNEDEGLEIDAWTSCPDWDGGRMDLGLVIEGLIDCRETPVAAGE